MPSILAFSVIFSGSSENRCGNSGNSRALLADGVNSTSDVVNYIVVKIFARLSRMPADREHPYGHHQMESICCSRGRICYYNCNCHILGFCKQGIRVIYNSYDCRFHNADIHPLTAIFTIGYKLILYFYTRSVGKRRLTLQF